MSPYFSTMNRLYSLIIITLFGFSCTTQHQSENTDNKEDTTKTSSNPKIEQTKSIEKNNFDLIALETTTPPKIDGLANDSAWVNQTWYSLSHRWLGNEFNQDDFNGRYKLSWNKNKLYLLVEIHDNIIADNIEKWDSSWWNDDCVEIFLDEDNGDDLHQFNYKAFAYHVSLNAKDVVDLGIDSLPHLYNNHIQAAKHMTSEQDIVWEFAIDIYDDSFIYDQENTPINLQSNKVMGFALAYCDNDTSTTRENFIGSIPVTGETDTERDQGWKDAGIFNNLTLK